MAEEMDALAMPGVPCCRKYGFNLPEDSRSISPWKMTGLRRYPVAGIPPGLSHFLQCGNLLKSRRSFAERNHRLQKHRSACLSHKPMDISRYPARPGAGRARSMVVIHGIWCFSVHTFTAAAGGRALSLAWSVSCPGGHILVT